MSEREVYVYVLALRKGDELIAPVKIGISQNPDARRREIATACPHPVVLFRKFRLPSRQIAIDVERCFHETHADECTNGEWFDIEPSKAGQIVAFQISWALQELTSLDAEQRKVAYELIGITELL